MSAVNSTRCELRPLSCEGDVNFEDPRPSFSVVQNVRRIAVLSVNVV